MIIYDIETAPLEESKIIGLFDENDIKMGNLKDPEKIAAKKEEAKKKFMEKAALKSLTGRVLAVGVMMPDKEMEILEGEEPDILLDFWVLWQQHHNEDFVGFNNHKFDLPFLIQRSMIQHTPFPLHLVSSRYWPTRSIDLRELWQCHDRQAEGSLNNIAFAMGFGKKNGSGAEFAELYESDWESAIAYLKNDLLLTRKIAEAMHVGE